jgi:hypothetical protein
VTDVYGIAILRLVTVIALTGVIFAGTHALGDESASQPRMSDRHAVAQLVDCMKKRMSYDRDASYNEARKTCRDQIAKQSNNTSSGTLVASATPPKP